jgi:large subunit ribosomal protein L9
VLVRQAGETGQLYGSVTARDLAEAMDAGGFTVNRSQIALNQPIKTIGMHEVRIALHPEVEAHIVANVARSEDEAARQARGEDVTLAGAGEAEEEAAVAAAEEAPAEADEAPEADETAES